MIFKIVSFAAVSWSLVFFTSSVYATHSGNATLVGKFSNEPKLSIPVQFTTSARTCRLRSDVVRRLSEKYAESQLGLGIESNNALIELFVSEDSGTWTLLVSQPGDTEVCLVRGGHLWTSDSVDPNGNGEIQKGRGLTNAGNNTLEVYVSMATQEWRITLTSASGETEVVAKGTNWVDTLRPIDKPGVDI